MPIFIDTNVPMYAGGASHPLREPAQHVIRDVASGILDAVTDAEVFQEILYRYWHIGEPDKGFRIFDHFLGVMSGQVLPVEVADVEAAREFAGRYMNLGPRNLIHLGVMSRNGLTEIITADEGFDAVDGIRRISLQDYVAPQPSP